MQTEWEVVLLSVPFLLSVQIVRLVMLKDSHKVVLAVQGKTVGERLA